MNWTDPRTMTLVELMGGSSAAPETINFAKKWAVKVGMHPLHVKKSRWGYSFNRLWRVIKKEVLRQIAEEIVDLEAIDRAWMLSFCYSVWTLRTYGYCGAAVRQENRDGLL